MQWIIPCKLRASVESLRLPHALSAHDRAVAVYSRRLSLVDNGLLLHLDWFRVDKQRLDRVRLDQVVDYVPGVQVRLELGSEDLGQGCVLVEREILFRAVFEQTFLHNCRLSLRIHGQSELILS